jgi:hypothetical protein
LTLKQSREKMRDSWVSEGTLSVSVTIDGRLSPVWRNQMKSLNLLGIASVLAAVASTASPVRAEVAPGAAPAAAPAPAPAPEPAAAPAAEPQPAPPPPEPAAAPPQQATVQAQAEPAAQAGAVAGESDHDLVVHRLAVGYLGRRGMLIGAGFGQEAGNPEQATRSVDAPIIGIRFWLSPMLGLDGGLGFYTDWGSNTTDVRPPADNNNVPAADQQLSPTNVFLFHIGVPLALGGGQHFSFQIVPEANVGFATQTVDATIANQPANINHSGFHLDIGARAGAELQFGFIGVPQLSLQGGVGLLVAMDSTKSKQASVQESTRSRGSISTTVGDNPWNIFVSNVAALYYF